MNDPLTLEELQKKVLELEQLNLDQSIVMVNYQKQLLQMQTNLNALVEVIKRGFTALRNAAKVAKDS